MDSAVRSGDPIHLPSICLVEVTYCLVEVTYLVEKGRVASAAMKLLRTAVDLGTFGFAIAVLDLAVADALPRIPRDQVPDLPDRVIAATALTPGLPLVTRDGKIRSSGIQTIW
jgi:predicted nucleic acid-binding protein